jgi:asparagine synthase (glutamine-hydrolysing)
MLESLLTNYDGHTTATYFADVNSFPSGHRALYDLRTHQLKVEPWYQVRGNPDAHKLRGMGAAECFKTIFQDAVRLRLRADVRVGTCLSGGLDSSSISAVASRINNELGGARFLAIHAKSTDAETDESDHARRAADALGIELHTVEPSETDFLATIDELAWTQEEPFWSGSMVMGWHVFQRAKALGCPVMLNGQGGDEALLGYERYFAALLSSLPWNRWPHELGLIAQNNKLTLLQLLQNNAYFLYPQFRILWQKNRSFLRNEFKRNFDFETVRKSGRSMRDVLEMQKLEIMSLQLPTLLRYEDRNSMRHSIETRLPFLDYRVVEFGLGLPIDAKLRDGWTKHVLRNAMSDVLPADIAWRRDKLGFEAPMRTWLTAAASLMFTAVAASPLLAEITDHKRLLERFPTLPWRERWRYFNVATWERVFGVVW